MKQQTNQYFLILKHVKYLYCSGLSRDTEPISKCIISKKINRAFIRLAYTIRGCIIPWWPSSNCRETSNSSVQEAGSLRIRGTNNAVPVWDWGLEAALQICWCKSAFEDWRSESLMSTSVGRSKNFIYLRAGYVQAWEALLSLFQLTSWPILWCYSHWRWIFPIYFADPHASYLRKNTHTCSQKCHLPIF